MAKKQAKSGTVLEFIGGVNRDRIGVIALLLPILKKVKPHG